VVAVVQLAAVAGNRVQGSAAVWRGGGSVVCEKRTGESRTACRGYPRSGGGEMAGRVCGPVRAHREAAEGTSSVEVAYAVHVCGARKRRGGGCMAVRENSAKEKKSQESSSRQQVNA